MEVVEIVGWVAVTLGVLFAWPQTLTALRSKDLAGLSSVGAVVMVLTSASWTVYGVLIDDPIMATGNILALIAMVLTAVVVGLRRPEVRLGMFVIMVAWFVVLVGSLAIFGPRAAGVLGTIFGVSMTLPQGVRTIRDGGTEGVSIPTHVLLLAVMGAWMAYGALRADILLIVPNILAIPIVGTVTLVLIRARRQGAASQEPTSPASAVVS